MIIEVIDEFLSVSLETLKNIKLKTLKNCKIYSASTKMTKNIFLDYDIYIKSKEKKPPASILTRG